VESSRIAGDRTVTLARPNKSTFHRDVEKVWVA